MTDPRLDVLCIGNAIVDVIADATDEFLEAQGLKKGSMNLIDTARAEELYALMNPGREISGGSAGNTAAGIAALGGKVGFIGQVNNDQLGQIYKHDIEAAGVEFLVAPDGAVDPTARCLILVTPDAQRTMNTYLGAAQQLPPEVIDAAIIADAGILYLEGYLWDPPGPRSAMEKAIAASQGAGRKVAFTLSDGFVIDRYRGDFNALIDAGKIDILFANEAEIIALTGMADVDEAVEAVAPKVPTLVVTRSEKGAIAVEDGHRARVRAEKIEQLVDTTGAGDLFAAGFLAGKARGLDLEACLRLGAIAAAEVIQHYGARPEADLRALSAGVFA